MRMGFREKHQRSTATFQQQDIIVRSYESTYDTQYAKALTQLIGSCVGPGHAPFKG